MGWKAKVTAARKEWEKVVDENSTWCLTEYLRKAERSLGVSRAYIFWALLAVIVLALWGYGGSRLLANLLGLLYPAHETFETLSSSPPAVAESRQWIFYWVLYSLLALLDSAPGLRYLLELIPCYHLVKLAFFCWCFADKTRGATTLYTWVRPLVVNHILGGPSSTAAGGPSSARGLSSSALAAPAGAAVKVGGGAAAAAVSDWQKVNELQVTVVSASGLPAGVDPSTGKVDCYPYCVLEVVPEGNRPRHGTAEETKYKTVCKTGTARPQWNEVVVIPHVEHLDANLLVRVYNKRAMGRDLCLGHVKLSLQGPDLQGPRPQDLVQALAEPDAGVPAYTSAAGPGELRLLVQLK